MLLLDRMTTRRSFLTIMGAAAVASAAEQHFAGPLGLETYSVRDILAKDLDQGLDTIRKLGFKEVEVASFDKRTPEEYRKALDRAGLKATSTSVEWAAMEKDAKQGVQSVKALGSSYTMVSWIPHKGKFTMDDCQNAIKHFNNWGEQFKEAGIHFTFHVHGYEFQPSPDGTLFDTLAKGMKPGVADFEMDTMWIVWPGQDPVALLKKYPGRWPLMHLKDPKKGVQGGSTPDAKPGDDVPVGSGQIDWPAVLKTAKATGVKRYYIEDESDKPLEQIPQSMKYLKSVRF